MLEHISSRIASPASSAYASPSDARERNECRSTVAAATATRLPKCIPSLAAPPDAGAGDGELVHG